MEEVVLRDLQLPKPDRMYETAIIPRSVYLNVIQFNFSEIDTTNDIPAFIYNECDKILGVSFITVVHMSERSFKCAIIDSRKWCLARLKYGV